MRENINLGLTLFILDRSELINPTTEVRRVTHKQQDLFGATATSPPTLGSAVVCTEGWAGRIESPCIVVGETKAGYIVRSDQQIYLPGRILEPGKKAVVPKRAIRFTPNDPCDLRGDRRGA